VLSINGDTHSLLTTVSSSDMAYSLVEGNLKTENLPFPLIFN